MLNRFSVNNLSKWLRKMYNDANIKNKVNLTFGR